MPALSQLGNHQLDWIAPEPQGGAFVLRAAGETIGRLQFHAEEGRSATGELDGRRLVFESAGPHHPNVTIRDEASRDIVATFSPSWTGGGFVSFSTGERYRWNRADLLSGCWCFHREGSKKSVCVSQKAGPLNSGGNVKVCAGAVSHPESPILVLLGWYLRVLAFERLAESVVSVG